jgi:FixJ family two-component response regulator
MDTVIPTVFIVEDPEEESVALSRMLTVKGYKVCTFESAERFLSDQDGTAPGCLLLDVWLPGMSGIELQHRLAGSQSERPIVFVTDMADIQTSVHAMKKGAIDFLTKPIDEERLFAAISHALRRDAVQREELAIRDAINKRLRRLTPRERSVLQLVISGRLNKQIAWDLGIGEKTVKCHRQHVMSKMDARSVVDLVQLCARVGIAKNLGSGVGAAPPSFPIIRNPSPTVHRSTPTLASVQRLVPC